MNRDIMNKRIYKQLKQRNDREQEKQNNYTCPEHERIKSLKIEVSRVLQRAMIRRGLDQRRLAQYLYTTESCISKICNYKTNEYTLSQVFDYLARIEPRFEILISI
jgi:hypothetical protein